MRLNKALVAVGAVVGALLVAAVVAYAAVAASLPRRSGEARAPGLTAPLEIELDARAIPRIRAASFVDALSAQGYMHAQERYFEMDLLRRAAAGELAELFGERALGADREQRPFEFRARARALFARLPREHRAWLSAYTAGVNAGLADLGARPPEYWLLGVSPEPWREEDSLLGVFAFYTLLSNNEAYERPQGVMRAALPEPLYTFLTPSTSRFDRPVLHDEHDETGGYVPLPIPGPDVIDLRTTTAPTSDVPRVDPPLQGPASNQWAVDATRGAGGRAILANDPHLALRLPNVFYRSELEWPGGVVRGVGIPGVPGILIGANATLAWGATVSNADQSDWVVIEIDPEDPGRYRTPDGFEPFRVSTTEIRVAGRDEPVRVELRSTRFGPVVGEDWLGRPLALHATWLLDDGVSLDVLELAHATSLADGIEVLSRWAGPSLNWMLAARDGEIGWVVNGPLPQRTTFDGSSPESWADGTHAWRGFAAVPSARGPRGGTLFTANNRTLERTAADRIGRMWMRPLRAKRIDDLLALHTTFSEQDFLAMQLDTRAEGYDAIRDVVLEVVPLADPEPLLQRARAQVAAWNGHADVDQPGFRVLHAYYRALQERAIGPLLGAAAASDPRFVYRWPLADEVLRRLLDERPAHLLTSDHAGWPEFLRTVLLDTLESLERRNANAAATWGDVNVLDVRHPFAGLPLLAPLASKLSLPAAPLPGSMVSLRVAAPAYGAVLRLAVAPAAPENGIMQLAAGQSGHFLSPHFGDQHDDWLAGTPTPFLAGPAVSHIVLTP